MIVDYHMHLRDETTAVAHTADAAARFAERGVDEIGFTEHVYEVDWVGGRADELAEILAPYPFDYLLGSLHWLDGVHAVEAGAGEGAWGEWPEDEVWRRYVTAAAGSGHFDVLAHPDLAKIQGVRGSDERYAELAAAADAADVALEISTAGLRKPVGEPYPDPRLLELSSAPVTLASDAHRPSLVGEDFDRAMSFARAHGRDTVSVFEGRTRRQEPLG